MKIVKQIVKQKADYVTEGEVFKKYIEALRKVNKGMKELKIQRSELVAKLLVRKRNF